MKLKELTEIDNKVDKFDKFIDSVDFDKSNYKFRHNGKDMYFDNPQTGIKIYLDPDTDFNEVKNIIKELVSKYWRNFEDGIDFHKYDNNCFVEVKPDKLDKNIINFIIEALDDSFYLKFNSNFIMKL